MSSVRARLRVVLRAQAWLLACGAAAWLVLALAPRISLAWPLEWMEGGVLQHVRRCIAGEPLYVPPTLAFAPFVYTPGAYFAMALPAAFLGAELPVLRAVSTAAFCGTLALIYRMASRHAHRPQAGLIAASLFALGFGYTGAFMDLARVDALFMLVLCWASERMLLGRTRQALVLFAACVLFKQQGLLLLVAASGVLLWQEGRRMLGPILAVWLGLALIVAGGAWASDGWFYRYTVALPANHGLVPELLASYFFVDVGLYLPVLAYVVARVWARQRWRVRPVDVLVAAALLVSAFGRAHPGGHDNVRLPGFALLCVLASGELVRWLRVASVRGQVAIGAMVLLQAAMLYQPPSVHHPDIARVTRGFTRLQDALVSCAGSRHIVAFDYGPPLASRGAHTMALSDLQLAGQSPGGASLRDQVRALGASGRADAVALGESFPDLTAAIEAEYAACAEVAAPPMTTGYQPPRLRLFGPREGHPAPERSLREDGP